MPSQIINNSSLKRVKGTYQNLEYGSSESSIAPVTIAANDASYSVHGVLQLQKVRRESLVGEPSVIEYTIGSNFSVRGMEYAAHDNTLIILRGKLHENENELGYYDLVLLDASTMTLKKVVDITDGKSYKIEEAPAIIVNNDLVCTTWTFMNAENYTSDDNVLTGNIVLPVFASFHTLGTDTATVVISNNQGVNGPLGVYKAGSGYGITFSYFLVEVDGSGSLKYKDVVTPGKGTYYYSPSSTLTDSRTYTPEELIDFTIFPVNISGSYNSGGTQLFYFYEAFGQEMVEYNPISHTLKKRYIGGNNGYGVLFSPRQSIITPSHFFLATSISVYRESIPFSSSSGSLEPYYEITSPEYSIFSMVPIGTSLKIFVYQSVQAT